MADEPLFIHLRTHSAYSLAEGMFKPQALVDAVKAEGQPAVAVTDTFNAFAALEFSDLAAAAGIQPIIGAQVMLADETGRGEVALLVQNEIGWQNLSILISAALLTENDEPEIRIDALAGHSEGLLLLTGGARHGFIAAPIADGQHDLARQRLEALLPHFDNRLYIEVQRHGLAREAAIEEGLISLAYDRDLPLVATNDCYFARAEDAAAHDVLLCISQSTTLADDNRRRETDHHYLKSSADMVALFADLPEAVANTVVIARRCAFRVPSRKPILPAFAVPAGMPEEDFLRQQAAEGLENRFATPEFASIRDDAEARKAYAERLEMELGIIIQMGFAGYFLIVSDFISWAKKQGIPVGPGRGSGAGSLVAYALTITDLDPIRWGLLFERFLNPERVSMPDFDIDFCQDRRDEVIDYVQQKYGVDKVAQIITFGSLQARAALRDVGRVMGLPYGQVDRIAKLVPSNPANPVTLEQALASEEELRRETEADAEVAELVRVSCRLEGLYRHASTHAAGLVIGDRNLPELVPLYRDPRSDMPVTQFNMKWVEKAGLVKFDFLGLKTLTVLQETLASMARRGIQMTLEDIPLADEKTFAMLSRGDTVGVFQLESSGMRDVLRGLQPDRFEDIIAVVALYRPGPMDNIPSYVSRKHGREEVRYMHPELEPILAETYGIMIYQEQVQQAAQRLAGYTLGGADILRRAMGKKIKAEMDAQRETFVEGSADNAIDGKLAGEIFDQIAAFAGYGFNKSHAAAYALIAWQTAWLKAHYPADFLAASMTLDAGNTDKISVFRQDCQHQGITILPPDINHSHPGFVVEETASGPAIRYALGAVRNVGMEAMRLLVEEREAHGAFASVDDFASRLAHVNSRRMLENLVKAGALDGIEPNRNRLISGMDMIIAHGAAIRREQESAQDNLFGDAAEAGFGLTLPDVPEATGKEKLENEYAALGLYISAHPLDDYAEKLAGLDVTPSTKLEEAISQRGSDKPLKLAGVVTAKQIRTSAKGNRFAFVQFTDQTGTFEVTLFSDTLDAARPFLDSESPLLIHVQATMEEGGPRLRAFKMQMLDEVAFRKSRGVDLHLADTRPLEAIRDGLTRVGAGGERLRIRITAEDRDVMITVPGRHNLSSGFRQMAKALPGVSAVREMQ
ncbi:MAG: DNA polymerase III subunit alpha [Candidatus Puniceispirillales bacterium]